MSGELDKALRSLVMRETELATGVIFVRELQQSKRHILSSLPRVMEDHHNDLMLSFCARCRELNLALALCIV